MEMIQQSVKNIFYKNRSLKLGKIMNNIGHTSNLNKIKTKASLSQMLL